MNHHHATARVIHRYRPSREPSPGFPFMPTVFYLIALYLISILIGVWIGGTMARHDYDAEIERMEKARTARPAFRGEDMHAQPPVKDQPRVWLQAI